MRRVLYLHGFASGPDSRKGRAFSEYFTRRGYQLQRLDLRVPDRDHLRVSAMLEVVDAALAEPALLVGSSLGGLVAAHAAAQRDDVPMCVLMAPAFRFVDRWRASLGEERVARWRAGEPLLVDDHAGGPPLEVDFGFYEDAARLDARAPDLRIPTLVFHGRDDDVVDIASSQIGRAHV